MGHQARRQPLDRLVVRALRGRLTNETLVLPSVLMTTVGRRTGPGRTGALVFVRHGDDEWGDVVRWTLNALITAEELGVSLKTLYNKLNSQASRRAA